MSKILITGATGTIGKALTARLHELGADFVSGVRDTAKAAETLHLPVEKLVRFDYKDPATYAQATAGVDRVFVLGPPLELEMDTLVSPFLDALKASGIKRVVYLSALASDQMGDKLLFHKNLVDKLKADGAELTVLEPSFFAQNFRNYEWENITQRGMAFAPAGTGKVAFVDVQDIAAVAAAALTQDGHIGKTYRITGPEALSYPEVAQILSEVTGKTIVYPNPSPEEYAAALQAGGAPDFVASYMISVYGVIREDKVNIVSPVVEQITGRKPTALRQVLERDFSPATV